MELLEAVQLAPTSMNQQNIILKLAAVTVLFNKNRKLAKSIISMALPASLLLLSSPPSCQLTPWEQAASRQE